MEFKVGDRVELIKGVDGLRQGATGMIVNIDSTHYAVEWNDFTNGHDCGGKCKNPRAGWWVNKKDVKLASSTPDFKIGDRVELLEDQVEKLKKGATGTIVGFYGRNAEVEWNGFRNGHSCGGKCKNPRAGWDVAKTSVKLVSSTPSTPDFKVGDRVQFKTWDEMEKEYGIEFGDINTPRYSFVESMKYLCGAYATIKKIDKNIVELKNCTQSLSAWIITKEMLKLVPKRHEFKVGDRVQFKSFKEMEDEYGTEGCGCCIKPPCNFNRLMKHLCETYATITGMTKKGEIYLNDFTAGGDTDFAFNKEMLKPVKSRFVQEPEAVEEPLLNAQELKILARTDKKWIARDKDGLLFIYLEKPIKDIGKTQWYSDEPYEQVLKRELFKMITWDNSPVEIIKLKEMKK